MITSTITQAVWRHYIDATLLSLQAAIGDPADDMYIVPGCPVNPCHKITGSLPSPEDELLFKIAGEYFIAAPNMIPATHEWHFNKYDMIAWVYPDGHEEDSGVYVFVRLPNDPEYAGFLVKEDHIH